MSGGRRRDELDEEIRAHLEMATRDRVARGMSPEFGNVDLVKGVTTDTWGWRWVEQFARDVRLSLRGMVREPGLTAVLVMTLALGIGANTAIFTIVHAALIERLPYAEPERLVVVWERTVRRPDKPNTVSPANFLRWQERQTVFERMGAAYEVRMAMTGTGDPEEVVAQAVTPDYFTTLGVVPVAGRLFAATEGAERVTGQDRVTVISHELWQRRFAGAADVVGRTIRLNGAAVSVIGITPPDTRLLLTAGTQIGKPPDLWLPLQFPASARQPRGRFMTAIARLAPGVTLVQAQKQMDTIAAGLTAEWPQFDTGWTVRLVPLHDELSGEFRPALLVLTGAVGFVLLIACANVANLLLARGAARRREFAIRTALGAGRRQVVRQLLTETLVLSVLGGLVGLALGRWGVSLLLAASPIEVAGLGRRELSLPVLAFTAAASVVTVIVCGLVPALEASRASSREALGEGARQGGVSPRSRRMRQAFVISEVALAVVLLVGAGLLIRSFSRLRGIDPGFRADNVLTVRVALPGVKYGRDGLAGRFFRDVVQRVAALPGVEAAGAVSFLPFAGLGAATRFAVDGRPAPTPGQEPATEVRICDNGYFRAMRIPLVAGRLFDERETSQRTDVVIVNQEMVRQYFAGEDPIGRRLVIEMNDPVVPTTIVGVVGDIRHADLETPVRPMTYWPHPQLPYTAMTLTVRAKGDPLALAPAVQSQVRSLDRDQPVSDVRTMEQWIGRSLARARFGWTVLTVFAALALLLTSIGIYGVMAYSVNQRTSEIGIRMALGASPGGIVRMVVKTGIALAAVGLCVGLVLAVLLSRTLAALLFDVSGKDPIVLAGTVAALGLVAVLASYLPARRAARTNPLEALRQD
jgi:putative ABC transport system permease protein